MGRNSAYTMSCDAGAVSDLYGSDSGLSDAAPILFFWQYRSVQFGDYFGIDENYQTQMILRIIIDKEQKFMYICYIERLAFTNPNSCCKT